MMKVNSYHLTSDFTFIKSFVRNNNFKNNNNYCFYYLLYFVTFMIDSDIKGSEKDAIWIYPGDRIPLEPAVGEGKE